MSTSALPPTAPTTLVIMLGASAWPNSPGFEASEAFVHAAQGFRDYLLDPHGFGLSAANLLDLFDATFSASDQLEMLGSFLEQRTQALKAANQAVRDVLVYFVGYGSFVGHDFDFYLAIRRTRIENPRASGIPMLVLADTLTEKARYLRRIIILDYCFAAAAFSAFQAGPAQVALEKTIDAFGLRQRGAGFPAKGTTLFCSLIHTSSSLLPDGSSTMFTQAVLDALAEGMPSQRERLSLREVKDIAADLLSQTRNAPRPVVLSPDQSEGDVADIPFFPNHRAAEEQARQTEEERLWRVVVERRHLAEEAEQARPDRLAHNSPTTSLRDSPTTSLPKLGVPSIFKTAGDALGRFFSGAGRRRPKEAQLSLFAIARTTLEQDDRAFVGKSYAIQAGISQSRPENFRGGSFEVSVRDPNAPLTFDILLHTSENIEPPIAWHKRLTYFPLVPSAQLVEFRFRVVSPGQSFLALDFYHERRWLRTVRFTFEAIESSRLAAVPAKL